MTLAYIIRPINYMRVLIQRVGRAKVTVGGRIVGQVSRGFLILCGFKKADRIENIKKLADKCLNLRVFEDGEGKMNLSLLDIGGEILIISQFTLYADCRKGRRPGFEDSMPPADAENMYNKFIDELRKSQLRVESGIFGAKMQVELVNDGPVTILLDDE
jgi:D-tyrosyl-tRNA(Tyr) deacylase